MCCLDISEAPTATSSAIFRCTTPTVSLTAFVFTRALLTMTMLASAKLTNRWCAFYANPRYRALVKPKRFLTVWSGAPHQVGLWAWCCSSSGRHRLAFGFDYFFLVKVSSIRCDVFEAVCLTCASQITPDPGFIIMQKIFDNRGIMDISRGGSTLWISLFWLSTPVWAFMPKYHRLPFRV